MPTTVVSGRVETDIKERVDRVLEKAGKTQGDVIRDVWVTIAQTGKLPVTQEEEEAFRKRREAFRSFMTLVESLPPCSPEVATMTDEQLRDMMVEDMLAKEARYVQAST